MYLSNHIELDQKRIIKKLNRNLVCEENFRSESNVLKSLRHNGIPIIYDIAVDDEAYYIIEEYIEGVSLYDYVKEQGTLSQDEAVRLGLQISNIIFYLHSQKPIPVLYLDLKPGNILIKNGKVHLVDFGNSMFLNADRKYMSGTRGYAAPEQFTFERIDFSTDVYGIGALLYFMVTGFTCDKQLHFDADIKVSVKFKKLIISCLSSKNEKRICDVGVIIENLNEILMGKSLINSMTLLMKKWISFIRRHMFDSSLHEKEKIIGVAGSSKGDGVTTFCVALANYQAEIKKKKVAIIECNDSAVFEYMGNQLIELSLDKNNYVIGKVFYFYNTELNNFLDEHEKEFECIIVDFGTSFENAKNYVSRLDKKFVLGSVMPYKSLFHEHILDNPEYFGVSKSALHILHGDEKNVKSYAKDKGADAMVLPFISNPYFIESKLVNFFRLLF